MPDINDLPISPDMTAVFVDPRHHGIGQYRTLDTIDRDLSRLDLAVAMDGLAQLSFRFRKPDPNDQYNTCMELDPTTAERYRNAVLRYRHQYQLVLVSPQALQVLAVRSLVKCRRNSEFRRSQLRDATTLLRLSISLQSHLLEPQTSNAIELVRLAAYYQKDSLTDNLEMTGRMLWINHHLTGPNRRIDFEQLLRPLTHLNPETVLGISTLAGLQSLEGQGNHRWPPEAGGDSRLSSSDLISWANLWASDLEAAADRARTDIQRGSWAVGSLVAKPLLRITDDKFIWLRPEDVQRTCSPVGFRDLFERAAALSGYNRGQIGEYWGRLFERACESQLRSHAVSHPESKILSEEDLRGIMGRSQRVCDNAVLEPQFVTVVDYTVSALHVDSLVDETEQKVWEDYVSTVKPKLEQLERTIAVLLERHPSSIFVPLIVVGGVLPWSGFVQDKLQHLVDQLQLETLKGVRVEPVRILSTGDYRWLLLTWYSSDSELGSIVSDWTISPLEGSTPLRSRLTRLARRWEPVNYEAMALLRPLGVGNGRSPRWPSPWDV